MIINEKDLLVESLYNEIGVRCPFLAAQHAGVELDYSFEIGKEISGIYIVNKELSNPYYHIVLNSNANVMMMEATCYLLLKQHKRHKDRNLALSFQAVKDFSRALGKERNKYLSNATESFLHTIAKEI